MRERAVDESFVINEIKDYLSETDVAGPRNNSLKFIRYFSKRVLRSGGFGSVVNVIRSKVQKISAMRRCGRLIAQTSRVSLDSHFLLTDQQVGRSQSKLRDVVLAVLTQFLNGVACFSAGCRGDCFCSHQGDWRAQSSKAQEH